MSTAINTELLKQYEAEADEFLAHFWATYKKRRNRLSYLKNNFLKEKKKFPYPQELEDIFQETVKKVADIIRRQGTRRISIDGQEAKFYPGSYFDTALHNEMMQFCIRRERENKNKNTYIDWLEAEGENSQAPDEFELDGVLTDDEKEEAILLGEINEVKEAVASLPQKYQEILMMVADDLRYREICRTLGLTLGQVKMRIMTARKLVKKYIHDKHEYFNSPGPYSEFRDDSDEQE